jgi:hypothetical protein
MAEYIPFITGDECCTIVRQTYSDAEVVRIPLDRAARLITSLGQMVKSKVWIDPCVDGLIDLANRRPKPQRPNSWFEHIKSFSHFDKIGSPDYWRQPNSTEVSAFVAEILDRCAARAPIWITVPQIPFADGAEVNKINRALARATGDWKGQSGFAGQLILDFACSGPRLGRKSSLECRKHLKTRPGASIGVRCDANASTRARHQEGATRFAWRQARRWRFSHLPCPSS